MLARLSHWMQKLSNGRVALVAFLIFVGFTALVLPSQAASSSASDAGTPDLSFYYSSESLYQMAESYGEQGRRDYVKARFTFDIVWPLVYTFFLVTATSWLSARGYNHASYMQFSNLVPIMAMGLDFLENISTSLIMVRYPLRTPVMDVMATFFTPLKWIFVSASFILLLAGFVAALYQWRQNRNR